MQTSKESSGVDKQGLFGWWHDAVKRQTRLHERAIHKALDIPEVEDVQNVGNKFGMTWKELAVIGAVLLGGYGAHNYFSSEVTQSPQAATTQGAAPVDSEYEVRFFDADGNPVSVPHVSARPVSK